MTIQRMDNVLIVVDDLDVVISFFLELGMELEGDGPIEGRWVERVIGIDDVRQDVAMLRTPDCHGRVELAMFHTPKAIGAEPQDAPANTLGIRRIMFAVDDIDDVVACLLAHGADSSASWRSTRTCIGSATSAVPRASSSDWPNNSAEDRLSEWCDFAAPAPRYRAEVDPRTLRPAWSALRRAFTFASGPARRCHPAGQFDRLSGWRRDAAGLAYRRLGQMLRRVQAAAGVQPP